MRLQRVKYDSMLKALSVMWAFFCASWFIVRVVLQEQLSYSACVKCRIAS
jgi:hypothetical protein